MVTLSISSLTRAIESADYDGQDIGHDSALYASVSNSDDFDAIVPDINMILAGLDQTVNQSYDSIDNYGDEIEDTPLEDLAGENGTFKVQITPEENFEMMRDMAGEATLHVPDHIMECLYTGLERGFKGTRNYHDAERVADGITDFLNFYAEPLPVKEKMGLDRYTSEALKSRHPNKSEDDFIKETAEELEANAIIATYDADYLDFEVDAASPKAIEHVLNSD